ncbi:MAG: DUF1122 family protein [Elusimicrobiota bacterium]
MSLKNVIKDIIGGIKINGFTVYAKKFTTGRFKEEINLDLYLKSSVYDEHLLYIRVYYGLKPYYRPWVEFFDINNCIKMGTMIKYLDSKIEEYLLEFFSSSLGPGGKIYVEYIGDEETSYGLTYSFPPAVTRLGYKLFNLGFTWFKDWYFPEGGTEGGQKLQGEKPLNKKSESRQLMKIREEILIFLNKIEKHDEDNKFVTRAKHRGKNLLNKFEK